MTNWNPVAALTADEITVATFAWSVAACALLGAIIAWFTPRPKADQ